MAYWIRPSPGFYIRPYEGGYDVMVDVPSVIGYFTLTMQLATASTLPYHHPTLPLPYPSPYPSSMLSGGNDGTITKRSASVAAYLHPNPTLSSHYHHPTLPFPLPLPLPLLYAIRWQ